MICIENYQSQVNLLFF